MFISAINYIKAFESRGRAAAFSITLSRGNEKLYGATTVNVCNTVSSYLFHQEAGRTRQNVMKSQNVLNRVEGREYGVKPARYSVFHITPPHCIRSAEG